MAIPIFDQISHTDFLRLTLEAFVRQGFEIAQSGSEGVDGVLIGKHGERIAMLCKKYRSAFIGRPVLQQFYEAMARISCKAGYLITTTDCSPEAHEFAKGKGIDLYGRDRTIVLLRAAFGEEFIRSGRMPELGAKAKNAPVAARQPVSVASYEKTPVSVRKNAPEPIKPSEAILTPKPEKPPGPAITPEPEILPGAAEAQEPAQEPEHQKAPPDEAVKEVLPKEVRTGESIESPGDSGSVNLENTTTIVCVECNQQLRVPIDQGIITVQCTECGLRRLYQPEMKSDGEVKTATIIMCQTCFQQLNVPINRGKLNVKCPKCGSKWVFTP